METSIVIPDHVIEQILLRLPVNHLLRWKCVSKHWYSLICDDEFIKKHYNFHYDLHLAVRGDVPLLLDTVSYTSKPNQFHVVSKDGESYVAANITAAFVGDTSHVFSGGPRVVGPLCKGLVNGIVCLQDGRNHVALWNPTTREIKDIPVCPIMKNYEEGKLHFRVEGFGFDLQSNIFKILGRINTPIRDYEIPSIVKYHIYSLKADCWKRIKDAPRTKIFLMPSNTDVYFNNGVSYWTAFEQGEHMNPAGIVSFNFSSEIFKEFELPSVGETWVGCRLRIGKYKEGIALLVDRAIRYKETCFEIWTVTKFRDDDNEVPSSWQLVVKVPPFYVANGVSMGSILDCGDILLTIYPPETDEVVEGDRNFPKFGAHIYNPSTRILNYLGFNHFRSSYRCVASLFPLSRRLKYIDMASRF